MTRSLTARLASFGLLATALPATAFASLAFASPAHAVPAPELGTTYTNSEPAEVDAGSALRSVSVPEGSGDVDDVTVDIATAKSNDGCPATDGQNYAGEIEYTLVSPSGTEVILVKSYDDPTSPGYVEPYYGATYDYSSVNSDGAVRDLTFDDDAATTAGPEFVSGTFKPYAPLSTFDGEPAGGTWDLRIEDTSGGQAICHQSFALDLVTDADVAACSDARTDLQEARADLAGAKQSVKQAKVKLVKARESGNKDRIEKAKTRVAKAMAARNDAKQDVADAQEDVEENC